MDCETRNRAQRCVVRWWTQFRLFWVACWARAGRLACMAVVRAEAGQSMVEYAIVIAVVVVALLAVVQAFAGGLAQVFNNLLARIQGIGA